MRAGWSGAEVQGGSDGYRSLLLESLEGADLSGLPAGAEGAAGYDEEKAFMPALRFREILR